ncbi:uncharacterized protein YpmB [Oikeobacillus pervagus]|uniref:Uncharacterized protein YpmB n=1 Tax=Oikeobacillus pervagus TaxID=1325931 RepID=A0AAJ1SW52_9BACI|nr:DUF5590 domain-containing protein [Oikeobacillus pervagus]MDQ0213664.1 uncharacterized protein YpmB [Oikeobacillus pervagus]
MKKWIFSLSLLFIFVIGFFVHVYVEAQSPYKKAKQNALKMAKDEAGIISVVDFYIYNSNQSYEVVVGKTKKKKTLAVWIPEKKNADTIVIDYSKGISKKEAIQKLQTEEHPREIISVRLGMEKVGPIWELAYLDRDDHLNYYYLLFENGKWWKKINNI